MHRSHIRLFVGVLVAALSLTAVGGALGGSAAKPKPGGSVVFGADQEPNLLNTFITGGDHLWAGMIANNVIAGSHKLTPAFVYEPYMISKVKVQKKPFRLTYYIKKNAKWYEGGKGVTRDVTAAGLHLHLAHDHGQALGDPRRHGLRGHRRAQGDQQEDGAIHLQEGASRATRRSSTRSCLRTR